MTAAAFTLVSTTLNVGSGALTANLVMNVSNNNTPFAIALTSTELLANAQAAGRPDWNTADVLALTSAAVGVSVVAAT